MYEIRTGRIPLKIWAFDIDEQTLEQARNIAELPFAFHHGAVMSDAHVGFGMPIGGVMAADGAVVPNAVGVDIGCGVAAERTSLEGLSSKELKSIQKSIASTIPLGFSHWKTPQKWDGFRDAPDVPVVIRELDSARYQLGTLGGGNHFIEVQKGDDGFIWIMVHSGSRNFGFTIAGEYAKKAKQAAKKQHLELPDYQLSPLMLGTKEADEYLAAMNFALRFAHASRQRMLKQVREIIGKYRKGMTCSGQVSIHHNYAAQETHFSKQVIIHRKGATSARKGERGIIPGSQGTCSYITEGLGNPESFMSCSHGAGRVLGRKEAVRTLNLKHEKTLLDKKGIYHSIRSQKDLDEAPGAYKDIDKVMEAQKDLVRPLITLSPLLVVKG